MAIPRLIVMLTNNDVTVPDSKEIFLAAKDAPAECWGIKDVGLPLDEMKDLVKCMKEYGKVTFMESIGTTEEDAKKGIEVAVQCGFDYLMGTHYFESTEKLAESYGIKHLPFVGHRVSGRLFGQIDDIVNEAVSIASTTSVFGINVSGFRYQDGDPAELIDQLVKKVGKPVTSAGSIGSYERLDLMKKIQPWGFTIGGAFFNHVFGDTFSEQISVVQEYLRK